MVHHIINVHKNDLEWVDEKKQAKFSAEDCKIYCINCDKKFISEESMNHHNDKKHGTGKFECSTCQRKFSCPQNLRKHKSICEVSEC